MNADNEQAVRQAETTCERGFLHETIVHRDRFPAMARLSFLAGELHVRLHVLPVPDSFQISVADFLCLAH